MTTWIVVADSSRARIFEAPDRRRQINEILDLVNPAAQEPGREIESDARGRYHAKGGAAASQIGHSLERKEDPIEHETELFAKRLAAYVDKARSEVRYDKLCLVAPPKFLGLLRGNLGKESHKVLKREIPKDLSKSDPPTILEYVRRLPDR
jgi:protein required for attachment to host cells